MLTPEEQSGLDRLYPSMKTPTPPAAPTSSIFGNSRSVIAPKVEERPVDKLIGEARAEGVSVASLSDETLAEKLYPDGGEAGGVLNDYSHVTSNFFDSQETAARMIHDEGELETIAKGREAVNQAFIDFQVGQTAAAKIMTLAKDFATNPRTADNIAAMTETTLADLKAKEGSRTDGLLKGGQRVVNELCRRIPNLQSYLDNGLGSHPDFVKNMIAIARRKGYC